MCLLNSSFYETHFELYYPSHAISLTLVWADQYSGANTD